MASENLIESKHEKLANLYMKKKKNNFCINKVNVNDNGERSIITFEN